MNLFTNTIEESFESLPDFLSVHPDARFFVSYEVFAIKLSYDAAASKWIFSTKNKPNAFLSFWSERRSFGNLFIDEVNGICGIDSLIGKLFKDTDYYFLTPLRRKNRVLLNAEEEEKYLPTIFLAAVHNKTSGDPPIFDLALQGDEYAGPWSFLPVLTAEEAANYTVEQYPLSIGVGHLSFDEVDGGRVLNLRRFLLKKYQRLRDIRNNAPDIYERYGELWKERSPDINLYRNQYAVYIEKFDKAIDEIYVDYKKRYDTKEYVNTTPLRHAILKKIKDIQTKRLWDTVTKNNVYNIVFKNFGAKLYKI